MFTVSVLVCALCSLASFAAGFLDAIAGGGGLLTLPAVLLAGVPPHLALGTNKFAATLGTLVALGNFARNHLVQWRMALYGLFFSLAGAWLGSRLTLYLDAAQLGKILVVLLPLGMFATLMPRKERSDAADNATPKGEDGWRAMLSPSLMCSAHNGWRFWFLIPPVCFAIGAYDGFFGPGTGSFLILAFHWILGTSLLSASATAKVLNLTSNFGALCVFLFTDNIIWPLAICMAVASMLGNWLGSRTAIRVGSDVVRRFLLVSLSILLLTLVWRYFIAPAQ